jgi:hypothetical protein
MGGGWILDAGYGPPTAMIGGWGGRSFDLFHTLARPVAPRLQDGSVGVKGDDRDLRLAKDSRLGEAGPSLPSPLGIPRTAIPPAARASRTSIRHLDEASEEHLNSSLHQALG